MCEYYLKGTCEGGSCTECEDCGNKEKHRLKGWECPVCGAGVSPYVTFCSHGTTLSPQIFRYSPTFTSTPEALYPYIVTSSGASGTRSGN
jgi:hypothetical protein